MDTVNTNEPEFNLLEIKLNEVRQLFNSLDPSPFHEKDLEGSAADYIVEAAREFHTQAPLKLVLHLPSDSCNDETTRIVGESVHYYFGYREDSARRELRFTLTQGRTALLIGLTFLFMCIVAQQFIASLDRQGLLWQIIKEGFLISGWVAMWKPIDIFLYQWWPIDRRRRLYSRLAKMPVELQPY
jgi:hypothetical protein